MGGGSRLAAGAGGCGAKEARVGTREADEGDAAIERGGEATRGHAEADRELGEDAYNYAEAAREPGVVGHAGEGPAG